MQPVHKLEWSDGLALAARDHCLDAGKHGLQGVIDSNSVDTRDRLKKYGDIGFHWGTNFEFGPATTGKDVVLQILVDNGMLDKVSRRLMVNEDWRLTGIANCQHLTQNSMTSIVYASKFELNETGVIKINELDSSYRKKNKNKEEKKAEAVVQPGIKVS